MSATVDAETLQDLVDRLGGIPLSRVMVNPPPGQATEADVIEIRRRKNRLCELVDGVLVEKPMGYRESMLAGAILALLRGFVIPRNLGIVTGADGTIKLFPGLVRIPDVAFASWNRIPGGRVPEEPIPQLAPDLAVEVLSESNTEGEMERKRQEYFAAGVDVLWLVDPDLRTVTVHERGEDSFRIYDQTQTIDNLVFLRGFHVVLADLFSELDRHQ